MVKATAVILASGKGERMGLGYNKLLYKIEKPLIYYTLKRFENNKNIESIIFVCNSEDMDSFKHLIKRYNITKVRKIVEGGPLRQDSCYNGVMSITDNPDIVIIQDAARPFTSDSIINQCIIDASAHGVSVVGIPSIDTIKIANDNGFVNHTPERNLVWNIQTPQTFKFSILKESHEKAKKDNFKGTDDVSLAERIGYKVKITMGAYDNIKITTTEDLILAEKIIKRLGAKDV